MQGRHSAASQSKRTDSEYQKLLVWTQMWAFRNGLLLNDVFVRVCVFLLTQSWLKGGITLRPVHILRVNSLACGHTVKFNQKNYICKEKDKYVAKLSGSDCFYVCVWPYFPLSVVCSYSNQYVSCLHWSGSDNHHSHGVSSADARHR